MSTEVADGSTPWIRSQNAKHVLAGAASLTITLLFLIWERELVWMLAVLLPPIWAPVLYDRFTGDNAPATPRWAVWALVIGSVVLVGLGVIVFVTS